MTDLQVLTENWESEFDIRKHRAPVGMMYLIKGVQITNYGTVGNRISIALRDVEEGGIILGDSSDVIYTLDLQIDGAHDNYVFPDKGFTAKNISIGFLVAEGAVKVELKIYYKLIKASAVDLIWDFIRRGKNP